MMIRHIYQYELDFACTSASGILYTLAKEKLNMSKFTKPMIASVLAVAVAGPAAAAVDDNGTFVTTKATKAQVSPSNCKNTKFEFPAATLEFYSDEGTEDGFANSGTYDLTGFTWAFATDLYGNFIERKVGKDLTASIYSPDLGGCFREGEEAPLLCVGIAEVIQTSLILKNCGAMTDVQSRLLDVTKGQIKLSKKGTQAKINYKVEGTYFNTKSSKEKKVKFTLKGSKFDFIPFVQ
jgi:hypothetical protein